MPTPQELMGHSMVPVLARDLGINAVYSQCENDIERAQSKGQNIIVSTHIALTKNYVLTVGLIVLKGGKIDTNGKTLAINGPLTAGPYQIFSGSGVTLGANSCLDVFPQWFGAVADGLTDDSGAINAMVAATRVSASGTRYIVNCRYVFPAGAYLCRSTLNFTGIIGFTILGRGQASYIVLSTTGAPGIDFVGSHRFLVRDLRIESVSGSSAPNVVILNARDSSNDSVGLCEFHNLEILSATSGTTCKATVYQYGVEDVEFHKCLIYATNTDCVGLYLTAENDLSITSPNRTISTGEQGATRTSLVECWIDSAQGKGQNYPMFIHNVRNLTLERSDFTASCDAYFYVQSDGVGQICDTLNLIGCRFEFNQSPPTQPLYTFQGSPLNDGKSVLYGEISGNIFTCSNAVIYQGGTNTIIYLGDIFGNNFAGSAPTHMVDTGKGGSIVIGGCIDANRRAIRTTDLDGTVITNLHQISDVDVTHNNAALLITDGLTQQQLSFGGKFVFAADATDPTGGGGAAAGRIPIIVSGVTKYLAYY